MAKFSKNNFKLILKEIEKMQARNENIDVPIGILEVMYNDYFGCIDDYFNLDLTQRDIENLWQEIEEIEATQARASY